MRQRTGCPEPLIDVPLTQSEAAALLDPDSADRLSLVTGRALVAEALRESISNEVDQLEADRA